MAALPTLPFTRDEGAIVYRVPIGDHPQPSAIGGNDLDRDRIGNRGRSRGRTEGGARRR